LHTGPRYSATIRFCHGGKMNHYEARTRGRGVREGHSQSGLVDQVADRTEARRARMQIGNPDTTSAHIRAAGMDVPTNDYLHKTQGSWLMALVYLCIIDLGCPTARISAGSPHTSMYPSQLCCARYRRLHALLFCRTPFPCSANAARAPGSLRAGARPGTTRCFPPPRR